MPNKESNGYIFTFSAVLVLVVSVGLTLVYQITKDPYLKSVELEKRQNILVAATGQDLSREEAGKMFDEYIVDMFAYNSEGEVKPLDKKEVFNLDLAKELRKPEEEVLYPVFVYEDGTVRRYVIAMRGNGLWGPIWGYLSVESDMLTVSNAVFDHKGETPGLGAEIKTEVFQKQFRPNASGKKLIASIAPGTNAYLGVEKPGKVQPENERYAYTVDGISGGTITSDGVKWMLERYIKAFRNYTARNISTTTDTEALELTEETPEMNEVLSEAI